MKKTPVALSLILLAALAAAAQAPAGWAKFTSPGSEFSVMMPAVPEKQTNTADSPNGPYTTYLFTARGNREIYLVGWVDYDPKFNFDVQAELAANRDKFIANLKAKLLGTTPIKLGAHPGIEFKAEVAQPAFDIVSRVYIVGRRPYQIIAITAAGQDSSKNVELFFSSFQVPAPK